MNTYTSTVDARVFATQKHEGQKYGEKPYTVHLAAVRDVLLSVGVSDDEQWGWASRWHDTVEDALSKREEIGTQFGADVACLVWGVTEICKNRK